MSVACARGGLHRTFKRAMYHSLDVADLGEEHFVLIHSEPGLRIGERIVARSRTKPRIARRIASLHPSKERLESEVYTHGNVLGGAAVDVFRTYRQCGFKISVRGLPAWG